MTRPVGSEVVVTTLQNKRGVIVGALSGGRYRVRVENLTVSCRESDLASPDEKTKRRKPKTAPALAAEEPHTAVHVHRVDLHGLTVEEARERVVMTIDRAILAGADRVEVVHGKGTGRVRDAVQRQLASIPTVRAFKLDEGNPGITWVYL